MSYARLLVLVVVTGTALLGCDASSGCEDAKQVIEPLIDKVCTEPAYAQSPFCQCCVANGLYSVDNDCECRALNFDTEVCLYAKSEQALPKVRGAVAFANDICSVRKPVIPWWPEASTTICRGPAQQEPDDTSEAGVDAGSSNEGS
jgi:hypothetical protein